MDTCWKTTGKKEEADGKSRTPRDVARRASFPPAALKKRASERVCNPFDSPHDGCRCRAALLVKSYAAVSLSLPFSHLRLPDSTGIDLGQLVWGSYLP